MHLVHNERVKLTAAWLNTVGAGTAIAGGVTLIVALTYGLRTGPDAIPTWIIALLMLVWILVEATLHMFARRALRRLRE